MVRKEILKLLEAGIVYPIVDSRWVSPVHCVPKKGGITVVLNDKNELIPERIFTGYRMVIDFRKLNKGTRVGLGERGASPATGRCYCPCTSRDTKVPLL